MSAEYPPGKSGHRSYGRPTTPARAGPDVAPTELEGRSVALTYLVAEALRLLETSGPEAGGAAAVLDAFARGFDAALHAVNQVLAEAGQDEPHLDRPVGDRRRRGRCGKKTSVPPPKAWRAYQ